MVLNEQWAYLQVLDVADEAVARGALLIQVGKQHRAVDVDARVTHAPRLRTQGVPPRLRAHAFLSSLHRSKGNKYKDPSLYGAL